MQKHSKNRNVPFPRPCGATGKDAQKLHALAFAPFRGAVLMYEVLCLHDQLAVLGVDAERGVRLDVAAQDALRDERLDRVLQIAVERTRAVLRVIGGVDGQLLGLLGQLAAELLVGQTLVQRRKLQIDDADDVLARERLIEDDLVEPVQELRTERALEQRLHLRLGLVGDVAVGVDAVEQIFRAEVARQDQDCVLEIDGAPLRIGDAAVVEHLKQDVEDVRVRLFDLVEEHDAIGLAAHGLGELTALVVADVSGRRSDQAGHAEFLHVFRHIDADEVLLVVKQRLGQRFGQLGLADARRAEEEERAERTVRILNPGAAALDGLGDGLDGLVLTDHALMQLGVEVKELLALALDELRHGDARPALDDLRDLLLRDLVAQKAALLGALRHLLLVRELLLQLGQLAVFQARGRLEVIALLGLLNLRAQRFNALAELLHLANGVFLVFPLRFRRVELLAQLGKLLAQLSQTPLRKLVGLVLERGLLNLHLDDLAAHDVQLGRHGVHLGADHGAGLVDEVNGLVGQEAVGDISVGEGRGGDDRRVGDLHAVEDLVALLQTAQDGKFYEVLADSKNIMVKEKK